MTSEWQSDIRWTDDGLVAVIVQDVATSRVLMLAWMSKESLDLTIASGQAVYWSRSRRRLWRKGEESGNVQTVHTIRLDCDGDALLLQVEQAGGIACHTGRERCFFRLLQGGRWLETDPVLQDPAQLYESKAGRAR